MPDDDAIASLTQGMPVEIGRIDRELKRLWQEGEGAATRASLINFGVYCEGAGAMRQTTETISQITRDHACRAILIGLDPNTPGAAVQASISAHCHLSRAGAKQVCCEQISFLLGRDGHSLVPNILFSHLDSDLPLILWWRPALPEQAETHLWTWVDRLIFDSQTWPRPGPQFQLLRTTISPSSPRMTLCDLAWTRSLFLRQAIAQIFDHPECMAELPSLDSAAITHAPGMRTPALLLAGWLAAQLQWRLQEAAGSSLRFRDASGASVAVNLTEQNGPLLGGVVLAAGADAGFQVAHRDASPFLHADIRLPGAHDAHYLMPSGKDDLVSLLNEELMSGGKHMVYLKAAAAISAAL